MGGCCAPPISGRPCGSHALPLASVSASPRCKLPDRSATLTALECALLGRGFCSAHCATARPGLGRKSPALHRRAGSSLPMSYSPPGRCMTQLSSSIMTPGSFSRSLERTFRKRIRARWIPQAGDRGCLEGKTSLRLLKMPLPAPSSISAPGIGALIATPVLLLILDVSSSSATHSLAASDRLQCNLSRDVSSPSPVQAVADLMSPERIPYAKA